MIHSMCLLNMAAMLKLYMNDIVDNDGISRKPEQIAQMFRVIEWSTLLEKIAPEKYARVARRIRKTTNN